MLVKLTGKFYWAQHLTTPQEPYNDNDPKKPKSPTWSILFGPDSEALETIRDYQAVGLKNVLKKDVETNEYRVKFSRPVWKEVKGKKESLVPPFIIGADPSKIGNGSEGILTLDVYEHNTPGGKTKAKAARLVGVEIIKLVEYNGGKFSEAAPEEIY